MKFFDKKTEKQTWLYILFVIPIGILILWKKNDGIGLKEIIILLIAAVVAIGMLYFLKWISNI
jgi:hypothetical protein